MLNILIIEDDEAIAGLISKTLISSGYSCEIAGDGEKGEDAFDSRKWDLVLLDLMLPVVSGYELLEYIRPTKTPVIIISAMNQVSDRIRGLRMGADDYLCKPFQVGELLARVEAVIRRTTDVDDTFSYRGVDVDMTARTVKKDGEPVQLTMKEYELLELFIRNKNIALKRDRIYESVWNEEYFGETRTLDNHIKRLRQKLGYEDVIQTVFRIGYRMDIPGE